VRAHDVQGCKLLDIRRNHDGHFQSKQNRKP
jgi:hypothetical protein